MISKKIIAGFLACSLFLTGCGQTMTEIKEKVVPGASATLEETTLLQNLPAGVMVFGGQSTDITLKKQQQIFIFLEEVLPEELRNEFREEAGLDFSHLLGGITKNLSATFWIQPKKEEFLFAEIPFKKERIFQEDLCIAGKASVSKDFIAMILNEKSQLNDESLEYWKEKADEEFEKVQKMIQEQKGIIDQFGSVILEKTTDGYTAFSYTKACDTPDEIESFFKKITHSQVVESYFRADRSFFTPFLTKGNLSIIQTAYLQGKKDFLAESEMDAQKVSEIEKMIFDPLQNVNFTKILQSFQEVSFVKGNLLGNFSDRHSETFIELSDEKNAEVLEEYFRGGAMRAKIWITDETDFESKVSRSGGKVYNYSAYKDSEYPSFLGTVPAGTLLVGVWVIGVIAAGATAIYSGAQEKAREAVRRNEEEIQKVEEIQKNLNLPDYQQGQDPLQELLR